MRSESLRDPRRNLSLSLLISLPKSFDGGEGEN